MKNLTTDTGWVPVHFDENEQEEIIQIGSSRRGVKEASGMRGEKLEASHQFGADGQVMGYAAECALAKVLGTQPQRDVSRRGNQGVHVEFPTDDLDEHSFRKHVTFNAAWVSDPTYDLRFNPNRVPKADVFMLLSGDLDDAMWIVGGVSRDSFKRQCKEMNFGHGLRLVVPQAQLTPARKILRYFGVEDNIRDLEQEHREKRLRREAQYGSLFGEPERKHRDPA